MFLNESPNSVEEGKRANLGSDVLFLRDIPGSKEFLGQQYVEEYTSEDSYGCSNFSLRDPPMYLCILKKCKVNNSVSYLYSNE